MSRYLAVQNTNDIQHDVGAFEQKLLAKVDMNITRLGGMPEMAFYMALNQSRHYKHSRTKRARLSNMFNVSLGPTVVRK